MEQWLLQLEQEMINTLLIALKTGVAEYENEVRTKFVRNHPGQIVATVCQIMWRRHTESAIEDQSMNPLAL